MTAGNAVHTLVALLFISTAASARGVPLPCAGLRQIDTLFLYAGEQRAGTLVQRIVADSVHGRVVDEVHLDAQIGGGGSLRIDEQREYDAAGVLVGAVQSITSQAGTNRWELVVDSSGARRIRAVIGGQVTERSAPASHTGRTDAICAMYAGIRNRTMRTGDSWMDTALDLMSGRLVISKVECRSAAVDRGRDTWELAITENLTGRTERWVLDTLGQTLLRSIPPLFVGRRSGYGGADADTSRGDIPDTPLTELFRAPQSRAARGDERIALEFADSVVLHESVRGLYERRDSLWVLKAGIGRCPQGRKGRNQLSADTTLLEPTPILQSGHPRIRHVADSVAGDTEEPCSLIRVLSLFVDRRIENRATATYSSALETLQSGFGDCGEHAVLLAALLRAKRVPARQFLGLVYMPDRKAYLGHAWVGVKLGEEWVFADPAQGRFPAVGRLVPLLIDDSGTEAIEVLRLIGRVTVEYVPD